MVTKKFMVNFPLVILFSFLFCERITAPISKSVRTLGVTEIKLVNSDNTFGVELFKNINNTQPSKNIFISPLSISMALGMTLNGAATTTYEAMKSALKLAGINQEEINESYQNLIVLLRNLDPKVVFQIANSIWYRQSLSFEKPFIETNKKFFDAKIEGLDFNVPASVDIINNWVSENTEGKIENIVDSLNPYDIMFLINAIYFKGMWKYQFDKNVTRDDLFYLPDGNQLSCKMMMQELSCRYLETEKLQAIDLPYGKGDYYMTIFLPKSNTDINSLISELTTDNILLWVNSFSDQEGTVQFPKFELEYQIQLKDILSSMGMSEAFHADLADFSKLYRGAQKAYLTSVLHKTYVEVNEEGTEAAAVTSVTVGVTSIGGGFQFKVNKPFFFIIRENQSNTILFIGKIMEPKIN